MPITFEAPFDDVMEVFVNAEKAFYRDNMVIIVNDEMREIAVVEVIATSDQDRAEHAQMLIEAFNELIEKVRSDEGFELTFAPYVSEE